MTPLVPSPDGAPEHLPQTRARQTVTELAATDRTAQALGIAIDLVEPGRVTLSMTVTPAMSNGHHVIHGGYLFLLADTAFAYASSTNGGTVVSRHAEITFLAPATPHDRLIATAAECIRYGNSGIYDVTVSLPDGSRIAEFRGHSQTLRGPFMPRR
jgi:acyl-CoA thioesterase